MLKTKFYNSEIKSLDEYELIKKGDIVIGYTKDRLLAFRVNVKALSKLILPEDENEQDVQD